MNVRMFRVRAMECMRAQTRPGFIFSSEGVGGNGVRTHVNFKGKIPSTGKNSQRRIEPTTQHQAGQRTQHTTNWAILAPVLDLTSLSRVLLHFPWDRLVGLVVKASASRAEDPGFESRLRREFFGVESYQWLKNWHSSGYPARRLAL